jgi:hypothetical protein
MWKHSIAIGRISPVTNETLFNAPYPSASLNTYTNNTGPPMLSTPILAHQLPDVSPETQKLLSYPLPWPSHIIQVSATPEPSGPPNSILHTQPTQQIDTDEISEWSPPYRSNGCFHARQPNRPSSLQRSCS